MIDLSNVAARARRLALQIVWDQWNALGYLAPAPGRRPRNSLVDPEALLLLTVLVQKDDPRLDAVLAWWLRAKRSLWSLQRLRSLLPMFSESVTSDLTDTVAPAVAEVDHRWRRIASKDSAQPKPRLEIRSREPGGRTLSLQLLNPAALVLRSRLLFGVNSRSDILVYLLGRGADAATVREIATTTLYARASVHQILSHLSDCRLVIRKHTRPHRYMLCAEGWQEVFGREAIRSEHGERIGFRRLYGPKTAARMWLCWPQVFSLLALLAESNVEPPAIASNDRVSAEERCLQSVIRICIEYQRTFFDHRLYIQLYHGLDPRRFQVLHDCIDAVEEWYTMQT